MLIKSSWLNSSLELATLTSLLVPPKWPSVKIEEIEDNQDNDTEMLSPSPPPSPKAGPLHPQPGEDATPQRYGLRRSTCETRISHREDNIYREDHNPTNILRRSK